MLTHTYFSLPAEGQTRKVHVGTVEECGFWPKHSRRQGKTRPDCSMFTKQLERQTFPNVSHVELNPKKKKGFPAPAHDSHSRLSRVPEGEILAKDPAIFAASSCPT